MDDYRRGVYSSSASLDEEDVSDDEASYDADTSAQGEVSEIEEWVSRERLPRKTSGILLDHGLTTLHDMRQLSTDFVTAFLLQTGLLPPATCMALNEALERLTVSSASAPATTSRGPQLNISHADSGSEEATDMSEEQSAQGGEHFRLLLLGKTGSGKSTTGNTILGRELFHVGISFGSVTSECELRSCNRAGTEIEIMDCPGLYDTSKTQEEIGIVIAQAVACMHPGPHAVLYVVKLDRFTAEEYGAYTRLKALFDDTITRYMIVVFTGGDQLERENKDFSDMLRNAPKELGFVLNECTHMVFNNMASEPHHQVDMLLDLVRQLKQLNGGPYVCPKYDQIGKGLEKEVEKRLEEVTKKDLARQKYVQDLKRKAAAAEDELHRKQEELEINEARRERRMQEAERQRQEELEELRQTMREERLSADRRAERERHLRERLERERTQLMRQLEQQREQDRQEMSRKARERDRLETQRRREEREERARRERAYEQEMREMKERIAQKKEPGFFERNCTIS